MQLSLILLAAGGSTRMGQPKQLLTYQGKTLLRRMAELSEQLPVHQRIVVLGKRAEDMLPELKGLSLEIVHNPNWESGMGDSIRLGMGKLHADTEGVLILLVDQPHVTEPLLLAIIEAAKAGAELVTAQYGEIAGVPALFGRAYFADLQGLGGKGGARKLIKTNLTQATLIPFPEGAIDVDTPEDYQRLLGRD